MNGLLMLFGVFGVPIAMLAAVAGTIFFRGIGWRIAAALPVLPVAGYFATVLVPAWRLDPTSHNLFPFELGTYFWPAFPYMFILVFIYVRRRRSKSH